MEKYIHVFKKIPVSQKKQSSRVLTLCPKMMPDRYLYSTNLSRLSVELIQHTLAHSKGMLQQPKSVYKWWPRLKRGPVVHVLVLWQLLVSFFLWFESCHVILKCQISRMLRVIFLYGFSTSKWWMTCKNYIELHIFSKKLVYHQIKWYWKEDMSWQSRLTKQ